MVYRHSATEQNQGEATKALDSSAVGYAYFMLVYLWMPVHCNIVITVITCGYCVHVPTLGKYVSTPAP